MTNHDAHSAGHHTGGHGTHGHAGAGHTGPTVTFGGHGMLIVGEETVYLSHLPMFMFDPKRHPHNFQVILEATFTKEGSDPQADYVNDRKTHSENVYTLDPMPFPITDLVSTDPGRPPLTSFRGRIVRGHFERGGTPILPPIPMQTRVGDIDEADLVVVNVKRVVLFRQFEPLEYFLFGKGQELFLAHVITKPPDFDQVISVKVIGHAFTDAELGQTVRVSFPGRANGIWVDAGEKRWADQRIREGERVTGQFQVVREDGPQTLELQVEAGVEFYFETGDLSQPM